MIYRKVVEVNGEAYWGIRRWKELRGMKGFGKARKRWEKFGMRKVVWIPRRHLGRKGIVIESEEEEGVGARN